MSTTAAGLVTKAFSGMKPEELGPALDAFVNRLQDLLRSNPGVVSLLSSKEEVPSHKAGDFVIDYREGTPAISMSDGKDFVPITISSLGGTITAAMHGNLGRVLGGVGLHTNATTSEPGFMSAADKVALNALAAVDPATTVTTVDASAGVVGTSVKYAREDHVHQVLVANVVTIGSANAAGSAATLARSDHVHNHGNQAGGTTHSVATTSVNGFMSATDKSKLDLFLGYTSGASIPSLSTNGEFIFWRDTAGGNSYIVARINGATVKALMS